MMVVLSSKDLCIILGRVAADIRGHVEELRDLDAVTGDGDLGITIELAAKGITGCLETTDEQDAGKLLAQCGLNINKVSPSTFGTLLAAAFMGAGQSVVNKSELVVGDLAAMGDAAVGGIKKRGKAEVGDKTMLDALVPGVEAFKAKIEAGADLGQALEAARVASEAGMKATARMKARYGRASRHQDGGLGLLDGGAAAMYYIIESFSRHLGQL